MSYCPSCEAEYQGDVSTCPDCDTKLVANLSHDASPEDMLDVYVCYDVQLTDRLVMGLKNAGITPLVRDRIDHAFPTNIGTTAEQRIAVPEHQHSRAHVIIQEAISDGLVSQTDGQLV